MKITADRRTVGWGRAVPVFTWSYVTLETSLSVLRNYYSSVLIERDPLDIEGASRRDG